MFCWFYRYFSIGRHKRERFYKALTLIELLIAMAIVGILSAIAVPVYTDYLNDTRVATAQADIANIEAQIERFRALRSRPPDTFAEASIVPPSDPWGNAYKYVRLEGLTKAEQDAKCRWDKSEKPLNYDYDLYSMGKDGLTKPKLSNTESFDDIIRANSGGYIGLASEY
jgi:general secretion pathway protein G